MSSTFFVDGRLEVHGRQEYVSDIIGYALAAFVCLSLNIRPFVRFEPDAQRVITLRNVCSHTVSSVADITYLLYKCNTLTSLKMICTVRAMKLLAESETPFPRPVWHSPAKGFAMAGGGFL